MRREWLRISPLCVVEARCCWVRGRRQETFVKAVFAAFLQGDVAQLAQGIQKIPADKRFSPLEASLFPCLLGVA